MTEKVDVRMSAEMVAFVDARRGARTRQRYLRDLVRAEARRAVEPFVPLAERGGPGVRGPRGVPLAPGGEARD